jgi:magnesium-transporting ATPase (P-type)
VTHDDEGDAISQLKQRLVARFPELPTASVDDAVAAAHGRFDAARLRTFVPLLVEHDALTQLKALARDLDPAVPSMEDPLPGTDPTLGLSSEEAAHRLAETGPNTIETSSPAPGWTVFLEQFRDPLIYLLLAAVGISLVVWYLDGMPGWPIDATVIVAIVLLNGCLGYLQQTSAERSLAVSRAVVAPVATVLRDGEPVLVPATEVAPGDVLLLGEGDVVAADARLVASAGLQVSEATLTGVSEPVAKDIPATFAAELASAPMVYAGTAVTAGTGRAVVSTTGSATRIGSIAGLVHTSPDMPSPLQREVARVGRTLGAGVLIITAVVVAVTVLVTGAHDVNDVTRTLVFGVSLAVAAVPEGLPALIAVVLALGVRRMAKRHAVVRQLAAAEALGSASVICSGKTGSLTEGQPRITRVLTPGGELTVAGPADADALLLPTDLAGAAVDDLVARQAALVIALAGPQRDTPPGRSMREFASRDRAVTALPSDAAPPGHTTAVTTGAPETLLDRCNAVLVGDRIEPMDQDRRRQVQGDVVRLSQEGLGAVAVAAGRLDEVSPEALDAPATNDLTYLGLLGTIDPPRPEAIAAVQAAQRCGVRVIMLTGDHPRTALPIARRLGITDDSAAMISGPEIDRVDDGQLREIARRRSVYTDLTPEQKQRVVGALQANDDVVAVTGGGVTDALAVKSADVGVAMGRTGAEVTRESAELVLTDDNLGTIVDAIREGRGIFSNIKKFLRYLISSNIGEVLTVFLGVVFAGTVGLTVSGTAVLPLLATQLLWINLLTDGVPALALGVDPETPEVMEQPPRRHASAIDPRMWEGAVVVGFTMALATLATYVLFLRGGLANGREAVDTARTAGFTVLVLAQMFNTFNARSETTSAFRRLFSNRWLWGAVALSAALQVAVVEAPWLNEAFTTRPLSWQQWLVCTAMASAVLWASELRKLLRRMLGLNGGSEW